MTGGHMADGDEPGWREREAKCGCIPRCPSEHCTGCCPCCRKAGRKQNVIRPSNERFYSRGKDVLDRNSPCVVYAECGFPEHAVLVAKLLNAHETLERPMTLGRLILETARGTVKERIVTGTELAEIRANITRYFKGPLQFREPQTDSEGPVIYDAVGNQVAMLYWPCHSVEETAAAEQATYALGHAMASVIEPPAQGEGDQR